MLELRDLYRCLQNLKSQQRQIKNFLANKKHMLQDAYNSYSQIAKSIIKEITNIEKKIEELLDKNNKMVGPGTYSNSPRMESRHGTIGHATRKTYAI